MHPTGIPACIPTGWQCSPRIFLAGVDFLECKRTEQSAGETNSSRYRSQSDSWDHHMLYQKGQMFSRPGGPESQVPASGSVVEKEK